MPLSSASRRILLSSTPTAHQVCTVTLRLFIIYFFVWSCHVEFIARSLLCEIFLQQNDFLAHNTTDTIVLLLSDLLVMFRVGIARGEVRGFDPLSFKFSTPI